MKKISFNLRRIGMALAVGVIGAFGYLSLANTPPPPPNPPSGLIATGVSPCRIDLSWTDNSSDETGFKIERSPNGSTGWSQIATVGANVTTYQNTSGLTEGTRYYYRVRAYNSNGDSAYSNIDDDYTWPNPPTFLSAFSQNSTSITLQWIDNSSKESGYKIERSPNGSTGWTQIDTVGASVTLYLNSGLTKGTTYYYRVRAYITGGPNSTYSNIDDATTKDLTFCF